MECYRRPNRSDIDIHLSPETNTREYFDGLAPKRHTKTQRSEHSTQYVDSFNNAHHSSSIIPEFLHFQPLETDPQQNLTGTGFIKVEKSGNSFHTEPDNDNGCHHSCKCNPATNDWVPGPSTEVDFHSDKPNTSDN